MVNLFIQNVHFLCKTTSKTLRKVAEKLCSFNNKKVSNVYKTTFPTTFSLFSLTFSHSFLFSIINYSFPLFHQVYNYNYLYKLIIKK